MIGYNSSSIPHNLGEVTKNHGNAKGEESPGEEETTKEEDERETEESKIGSISSE